MRKRLLIAVAILLSASLGARADVFTTFAISGTLVSGSTLSGTATLDSTTGVFTAANVTASSPDSLTFGSFFYQDGTSYAGDCTFDFYSSTGFPVLAMVVVGNTLVGYDGGAIGSLTNRANGVTSDLEYSDPVRDYLVEGALTPIPEPSSFALLGTGALGFAGVVRRRISR